MSAGDTGQLGHWALEVGGRSLPGPTSQALLVLLPEQTWKDSPSAAGHSRDEGGPCFSSPPKQVGCGRVSAGLGLCWGSPAVSEGS